MTVGEARALLANHPDDMLFVVGARDGYHHPTVVQVQVMRPNTPPSWATDGRLPEPSVNYCPETPLDEDEEPNVNMLTIE